MTTAPVAQLLQALAEAVGARVASVDEKRTYQKIFEHLPISGDQSTPLAPRTQPACRNLGRCYVNIDSCADVKSRAVAAALRTIEQQLDWRNYAATDDSPALDTNYADAIIAGPDGLIHSDLIEVGVLVMSGQTIVIPSRPGLLQVVRLLEESVSGNHLTSRISALAALFPARCRPLIAAAFPATAPAIRPADRA